MSDPIKELFDDEELNPDPEKFFNEEEYSTLIINREGFSKKENTTADLVESLLEPNLTRPEKEELFSKLKEAGAQQLLVDSIAAANRIDEKVNLTAACWETGLDFTRHFLFFVDLACHPHFNLALEALTVVENCAGKLDEATLAKALEKAESAKNAAHELADDLISSIKHRML